MMTRKHFKAIAQALADAHAENLATLFVGSGSNPAEARKRADAAHANTCRSVAGVLADENERFNWARFLVAAGASED